MYARKEYKAIQDLLLFSNRICACGAEYLASALEVNETSTTLVLSFNNLGNLGAKGLVKSLELNTALTKLWLPANHLGNDALPIMKDLKDLNLDDVFDNNDARSILQGLRQNVELDTLLMDSTFFENDIIAAEMGLYLECNSRLAEEYCVILMYIPCSVWLLVLARANDYETGEPRKALYYFICQKPKVFSHGMRCSVL